MQNRGKLCLMETVEHMKYMLTIMKPDNSRSYNYEASDLDKLEKAVQQNEDWINKNPHAHQDQFYKRERKLMKLCEDILERTPTPMPRTPPPSEGGDSSRRRIT